VLETLPLITELYTIPQLAERHAHLFPKNRLSWAVRNRDKNGLEASGAVFKSPTGHVVLHEPKFLAWFLWLTGRNGPRRGRRMRAASLAAQRAAT
jgi:hypothetical protein